MIKLATSIGSISIGGIDVSSLSMADLLPKIDTQAEIDKSLMRLKRIDELKRNIGPALFDKLSQSDLDFILDLSGTINLGPKVDIELIYNLIEEERDEQ